MRAQRIVEGVEDGQDRQQIDDRHRRERVDRERQRPFSELQVRRDPSGQVVDDEHKDAPVLDCFEDGAGFFEAQG